MLKKTSVAWIEGLIANEIIDEKLIEHNSHFVWGSSGGWMAVSRCSSFFCICALKTMVLGLLSNELFPIRPNSYTNSWSWDNKEWFYLNLRVKTAISFKSVSLKMRNRWIACQIRTRPLKNIQKCINTCLSHFFFSLASLPLSYVTTLWCINSLPIDDNTGPFLLHNILLRIIIIWINEVINVQ